MQCFYMLIITSTRISLKQQAESFVAEISSRQASAYGVSAITRTRSGSCHRHSAVVSSRPSSCHRHSSDGGSSGCDDQLHSSDGGSSGCDDTSGCTCERDGYLDGIRLASSCRLGPAASDSPHAR